MKSMFENVGKTCILANVLINVGGISRVVTVAKWSTKFMFENVGKTCILAKTRFR